MHSSKKALITAVIGLVVGLGLLVPSLTEASEFDLRTVLSFNHPVTVPNAVLQPNTDYVMSVGDAQVGMRNVVRIYKGDESQLVTQFLAINKEQLNPVDKTTLTFMETAAGYPQPVESWFYPGRNIGLEFIYPKTQLAEIALHMRGAETTQTAAVINESPATELPRSDDQALLEQDHVAEPAAPVDQSVDQSAAVTQSDDSIDHSADVDHSNDSANNTNDSDTDRSAPTEIAQNELPRTAGELPLLALMGSLATGLGFAVRSFRR